MDNKGEILIYQTEDGLTKIEVNMEDETVWLNQTQLMELYQCSKSNISEHITNIFNEGELKKEEVVRKFRTTGSDGKMYSIIHYNSLKSYRISYTMQLMVILRQKLSIRGQMQRNLLWD